MLCSPLDEGNASLHLSCPVLLVMIRHRSAVMIDLEFSYRSKAVVTPNCERGHYIDPNVLKDLDDVSRCRGYDRGDVQLAYLRVLGSCYRSLAIE